MKRSLIRVVSFTSLLLLIGAGVGLVVFRARGGRFLSVQTGSMEPHIARGSLVAINRTPTRDIKEGDVITYINQADRKQTITHRVVGTMPSLMSGGRPYFITKGDANEAADRPVQESAVLGKVSAHVPYAGFVVDMLRKPLGLVVAIYLPALVVIGYELKRLIRYYRSIKPYDFAETHRQQLKVPAHLGMVLVAGVMLVILLGFAVPVFAALRSDVKMQGNSITGTGSKPAR